MRTSELIKFSHFHTLKLLFPSIFCWYILQILCFRTFNFRCQHDILHTIIQSMQFPFITHGMVLYINDSIYQQNTNIEKCMCMRASGPSELRKFLYFYILKLLFLSIFCRYIRYFVGTNDMLVGLHVPTNFQMYRQKSEKALLGGQLPPLPPLWLR